MDIELVQLDPFFFFFAKLESGSKPNFFLNGELGLTKSLKRLNRTKFSVQSGQ